MKSTFETRLVTSGRAFLTTQHDASRRQPCSLGGEDFTTDLDKAGHDGIPACMQGQRLARRNAAEDLELAHGGEADVAERMLTTVTLGQDAAELRKRFNHDDAWKQRLTWKVALQKGLIPLERPAGSRTNAWNHLHQLIDETERRSVRKGGKRLEKNVRLRHTACVLAMKSEPDKRQCNLPSRSAP